MVNWKEWKLNSRGILLPALYLLQLQYDCEITKELVEKMLESQATFDKIVGLVRETTQLLGEFDIVRLAISKFVVVFATKNAIASKAFEIEYEADRLEKMKSLEKKIRNEFGIEISYE